MESATCMSDTYMFDYRYSVIKIANIFIHALQKDPQHIKVFVIFPYRQHAKYMHQAFIYRYQTYLHVLFTY